MEIRKNQSMMKNSFHVLLVRLVFFPLTSWLYNRRKIKGKYRFYLRFETVPQDDVVRYRLIRLREILEYAERFVPYYGQIFRDAGFKARDLREAGDMRRIPILSRQDVIDNRESLVDYRYRSSVDFADRSDRGPAEPIMLARFRRHKLVRNTSSGSTGYPTVFYEDGSVTAANWALELRLKKWYGVNSCEKEARLVRMSRDYDFDSSIVRFRRLLWNQLLLPGVNLGEKDYMIAYEKLNQFEPVSIWGFTSSLAGLAEFVLENNLKINFSAKIIITWAAPLYDFEAESIKKVFRCPVTNIYGTRELGHIASYCPSGRLHVHDETHFVENEVEHSGSELIVTPLIRSPMPFIRYRTGDIGFARSTDCSCGRHLSEIGEFTGRTGEVYIAKNGKMISPNFWCRTFMDAQRARAVKRFQIVYKKDESICITIVKNRNYTVETEDNLKKYLADNLSDKVRITIDYAADIAPQVSGKYQMVRKE